tara:strand:+ start:890 stop:1717 length:828 start_codon:yes stop_codon:yes gene_type:complete
MNIIYITGLSRSGTTYLSSELVNELSAISIGESIKNIEIYQDDSELERYKKEDRKCTCGNYPNQCEFWGDILSDAKTLKDREVFELILRKLKSDYSDAVIIDTSKTAKRLERFYTKDLLNKYGINIIAINLIRHCYGQIDSYQSYHKKWNRKGIRGSIFTDAIYWLYKNYVNINFFKKSEIESKTIFYEDLIFERDSTISAVKDFVNNSFKQYSAHQPVMHEMSGNEGFKRNSNFKMSYKSSWMFSASLSIYSLLLFPVLYVNSIWYRKYGTKKL